MDYKNEALATEVVCVSDTHGFHEGLNIPTGDILIHAGDFTGNGTISESQSFLRWFRSVGDFSHRILVAGNHDWLTERNSDAFRALLPGNVTYLCDSGIIINGLKFWGSPVQPTFHNWAWNRNREDIALHWRMVPQDVDVLITHGPPLGILDRTAQGRHVGCPELAQTLKIIQPQLHIFGHIHEAYGSQRSNNTLSLNASICDLHYRPIQRPQVVFLNSKRW